MKLKEIKIRNFRGFKDEVVIPVENITAFVGKNDSGKSTVLEALAVFFGEQEIECEDAHIKGDKKDVGISCVFGDLPQKIVLDSEDPTNLGEEHLLRGDGLLEIERKFHCAGAKPKVTGVFVAAAYPSESTVKDLHTLNNTDLKKRLEQVGAKDDAIDIRGWLASIDAMVKQ